MQSLVPNSCAPINRLLKKEGPVDSAAPRSVFHVNANLPVQMLRKADCATMAGRQQIRDRLGGSTENLNCEIEADLIRRAQRDPAGELWLIDHQSVVPCLEPSIVIAM